jgi:lysophospholipid acyltransferase (LPLAT)-like uncharacterized protein
VTDLAPTVADSRVGAAPAGSVPATADRGVWGRLLLFYLRAVGRHARLQCRDEAGALLEGAAAARRITTACEENRAAVLTYWVADSLAISMLPFAHDALAGAFGRVEFLVDETFGGLVTATVIRRAGGLARVLALPGDPRRLQVLREVLRVRRAYGFAVDGGGPYGQVGTGVVGLAGTLDGVILPMAARARPAVGLRHRSCVSLPLPGCRLEVGVGTPLRVDRYADRRAVAESLRDALHGLHRVLGGPAA